MSFATWLLSLPGDPEGPRARGPERGGAAPGPDLHRVLARLELRQLRAAERHPEQAGGARRAGRREQGATGLGAVARLVDRDPNHVRTLLHVHARAQPLRPEAR